LKYLTTYHGLEVVFPEGEVAKNSINFIFDSYAQYGVPGFISKILLASESFTIL